MPIAVFTTCGGFESWLARCAAGAATPADLVLIGNLPPDLLDAVGMTAAEYMDDANRTFGSF